MAKSVPDKQVEDVLSSVRRLVSGEIPRNERPRLPDGPGALVLTNAQRIEANSAVRIAGRTLEERIAELEVAISHTANDDEFEPDGSEDQAMHRPDRIVYTRPPASEESDKMRRNTLRLSQIALIDTGPDDEDPDADSNVQMQFRRDAGSEKNHVKQDVEADEAPMAEDVKETLTAAEVHIFSSPDAEIARIEARLNGEPEPERPISVPTEAKAEPEAAEPEPQTDDPAEKVSLFTHVETADTEELAEVQARAETEPDTPGVSDAPGVLQLHPDTADAAFEADLKAALAEVATPEDTESDPQEPESALAEAAIAATLTEEYTELDEDSLRPLVAKLIREELQGELGQRITRNVRKLVRREILLALAARDIE